MRGAWGLLLLMVASQASAEILFIDLNNAEQEIEGAKEAAIARGEKPPVVFPGVNAAARKVHEELAIKTEDLAAQIKERCPSGSEAANCPQLRRSFDKASSDLRTATAKNQITAAQITAELKRLRDQGVSVTSVVISGHDGNGKFKGVYGNLSASELENAFQKVPEISKDVRSVLLWGCYTSSLGSLDGHWRQVFPSVSVFAGFDGRGPSKRRPASRTFLRDFLINDKKLMNVRDRAAAEDIVKKFDGFNDTQSSVCIGDWILTPLGSYDVSELREKCGLDTKMKDNLNKYNCYREATAPGCEEPPTKSDSGPIFELYDFIAKRPECRSYWNEIDDGLQIPEPQDIRFLRFYGEVRLNLGSLHGKDLAALDDLLKKVGAPAKLRVSEFPKMNRAQIKKRLSEIEQYLAQPDLRLKNHPQAIDLEVARQSVYALSTVVSEMNRTPEDWYEPVGTERATHLTNTLTPERYQEVGVQMSYHRLGTHYDELLKEYGQKNPQYKAAQTAYQKAMAAFEAAPQDPRLGEAVDGALTRLNQAQNDLASASRAQLVDKIQADKRTCGPGCSDYDKAAFEKLIDYYGN